MGELKPLEWGETSYGTPEVHTIVGVYRLNHAADGGWNVVRNSDVIRCGDGRSNRATVDEAKAAALADYEARIMSAFLRPVSRSEVLEEAVKEPSEGIRLLVEKLTSLRLQAFSGAYSSSVREPAAAEFERLMLRPEIRNQLIDFVSRALKTSGNDE